MNINPGQQEQWLKNLKIKDLNPMQSSVLESTDQNKNIILLSQTGSGKTLAFLLPLLASIDTNLRRSQALIMAPSRELVLQIESVLKQMQTGISTTACYGGHKREIEENNLKESPAIVIGTAGRMADHIRRGNITVDSIRFLVMDEFDKILELGFLEEMELIVKSLPNVQQRLLTSATSAVPIPGFVAMNDAIELNFIAETDAEPTLRLHKILSSDSDKLETAFTLCCYVNDTSSIIFCNHRDAVERVSNFLKEKGIVNVFYHGGMEQHDREVALCKFRNTSANVLVTTDLASRGLDIANIRNIIHYHLPHTGDAFTHRNGRTARMGATGNVYMLIGPEETIPDFISNPVDVVTLPENLPVPDKPKWSTLFIAAGKKNKINKIDIVGFLSNKGHLKKDEIGLIEVKDHTSFAAIRKSKVGAVIESIKDEKIKNQKIKIALAR